MSTPDTAVNFRENCSKETQYTFSYVFDEDTPQKSIFYHVALPLIDGLLHGRNGLLFTYGITGSGKTYTMTGTPEDSGIMLRAVDVLYNSISELQSKKFVFKPDRLNGFEIQSEEEAKREGLVELQTQTPYPKTPRVRRQESEWSRRIPEETKINAIDEDNMYAVFVTYVEVYNNNVYDLLDDSFEDLTRSRVPQTKLVREDGAKNMYVHGVMEVEVKSTDEAFEVFNKGQRRKRMAHNTLNTESSRSHSVFTIRLVQAPLDAYGETMVQDKKSISVSQLSFVDLAGSERTNRTNTSGYKGATAFPYDLRMASTESLLLPSVNTPSTITTRRKVNQHQFTPRPTVSAAVSNPRHRCSQSVSDDRWLDHRPQQPVPLNTVLQPVLKKRKSVSKLTD